MRNLAKKHDLHSVLITYDQHPRYTLAHNRDFAILSPTLEKLQLLKSCGIDHIEVLPFTPELAQESAQKFLSGYILPNYSPKLFILGHDSHFGHNRSGNYRFLKKTGKRSGFSVLQITPVFHDKKPISSTMIRNYLLGGDLDLANKLLGRRYSISGKVIKGAGIGKSLGFPTANLFPNDQHQLIPRTGIYIVKAYLGEQSILGLTNIGISPTLKSLAQKEIETYLLDFSAEIYDQKLRIEFVRRIRDEKKFSSTRELIFAMQEDLATLKAYQRNE